MNAAFQSQSQPVSNLTAGMTVEYRPFLERRYRDQIQKGTITKVSPTKFLGNSMYYIEPAADAPDQTKKWLMPYEIVGQVVETVDEKDAAAEVNAAYSEWEAAWLRGDDPQKVAQLSQRHSALHDAHMKRLFPRLTDKQHRILWGTTPKTAQTAAPITVEAKSATHVHPLAQTVEGTAAHALSDTAAVKAKRDAQYAEAKARVQAISGVYQHRNLTGITMHSADDIRQMFKSAK